MSTSPTKLTFQLSDFLSDVFDGPRRIQFKTNGAPYIRLGDLEAGEIYFDPCETIAPLDLEQRFYLRPGDVLVSKTGDEPRAVVTPSEAEGALIASDIYCLRTHTDQLSPTWLAYYLNTLHGQKLLSERITGDTVRRLRVAELRSLPLLVPPKPILHEVESLEQQAQAHTQAAHEMWASIQTGVYTEVNERCGLVEDENIAAIENFFSTPQAHKLFRPLSSAARIAISSRKTLKPDQLVSYVQTSDIDAQSFLFRRVRRAKAKDLPSRIRLPLQAYQVLLLASGSNLGTPAHPIAVVDAKLHGGFASNAFLALEFAETPIYYAIALKHPLVLAQLRRMAVGPVVSTLRKKDIIHLRIPQLSAVWRQDFNDRAQLAWERRTLALTLRRQALDQAEAFIEQALAGAAA